MMTKPSRILLLVAALALGLVYVLPLWRIDLEAPQYPEGIGMVIRIDAIEGKKPQDLNNINNLNHYIGMKRIVPESIPELKIMPFVVAGLLLTGLVAAALGRRRWLYAWVGVFVLVSLAGLVDFWKWEYDYGHDLDFENAIIDVPGMTYQPPLIGSKQLLNFRAHSWPGSGGWILIASCLTGVALAAHEYRRGRRPGARAATGAAAMVLLTACGAPAPRPVEIGVDMCEHCLMTIEDDARAAEILTPTGRAWTFDSVECMVGHLQSELEGESIHSAWVTDSPNPPALVRADVAYYLRSDGLPSPMGLGLTAFMRAEDRDAAARSFGGEALDWEGVQTLVGERWPDGRPPIGGRAHGGHGSELLGPPPVGAQR
jgi:copper chaperone NosL